MAAGECGRGFPRDPPTASRGGDVDGQTRRRPLTRPSTKSTNRNHEQHVDEVSERVAADQSEQPQHQQNHRNRKKHHFLLLNHSAQAVP